MQVGRQPSRPSSAIPHLSFAAAAAQQGDSSRLLRLEDGEVNTGRLSLQAGGPRPAVATSIAGRRQMNPFEACVSGLLRLQLLQEDGLNAVHQLAAALEVRASASSPAPALESLLKLGRRWQLIEGEVRLMVESTCLPQTAELFSTFERYWQWKAQHQTVSPLAELSPDASPVMNEEVMKMHHDIQHTTRDPDSNPYGKSSSAPVNSAAPSAMRLHYEQASRVREEVESLILLQTEACHSLELHLNALESTHDSGAVERYVRELGEVAAAALHAIRLLRTALVALCRPSKGNLAISPPATTDFADGPEDPGGALSRSLPCRPGSVVPHVADLHAQERAATMIDAAVYAALSPRSDCDDTDGGEAAGEGRWKQESSPTLLQVSPSSSLRKAASLSPLSTVRRPPSMGIAVSAATSPPPPPPEEQRSLLTDFTAGDEEREGAEDDTHARRAAELRAQAAHPCDTTIVYFDEDDHSTSSVPRGPLTSSVFRSSPSSSPSSTLRERQDVAPAVAGGVMATTSALSIDYSHLQHDVGSQSSRQDSTVSSSTSNYDANHYNKSPVSTAKATEPTERSLLHDEVDRFRRSTSSPHPVSVGASKHRPSLSPPTAHSPLPRQPHLWSSTSSGGDVHHNTPNTGLQWNSAEEPLVSRTPVSPSLHFGEGRAEDEAPSSLPHSHRSRSSHWRASATRESGAGRFAPMPPDDPQRHAPHIVSRAEEQPVDLPSRTPSSERHSWSSIEVHPLPQQAVSGRATLPSPSQSPTSPVVLPGPLPSSDGKNADAFYTATSSCISATPLMSNSGAASQALLLQQPLPETQLPSFNDSILSWLSAWSAHVETAQASSAEAWTALQAEVKSMRRDTRREMRRIRRMVAEKLHSDPRREATVMVAPALPSAPVTSMDGSANTAVSNPPPEPLPPTTSVAEEASAPTDMAELRRALTRAEERAARLQKLSIQLKKQLWTAKATGSGDGINEGSGGQVVRHTGALPPWEEEERGTVDMEESLFADEGPRPPLPRERRRQRQTSIRDAFIYHHDPRNPTAEEEAIDYLMDQQALQSTNGGGTRSPAMRQRREAFLSQIRQCAMSPRDAAPLQQRATMPVHQVLQNARQLLSTARQSDTAPAGHPISVATSGKGGDGLYRDEEDEEESLFETPVLRQRRRQIKQRRAHFEADREDLYRAEVEREEVDDGDLEALQLSPCAAVAYSASKYPRAPHRTRVKTTPSLRRRSIFAAPSSHHQRALPACDHCQRCDRSQSAEREAECMYSTPSTAPLRSPQYEHGGRVNEGTSPSRSRRDAATSPAASVGDEWSPPPPLPSFKTREEGEKKKRNEDAEHRSRRLGDDTAVTQVSPSTTLPHNQQQSCKGDSPDAASQRPGQARQTFLRTLNEQHRALQHQLRTTQEQQRLLTTKHSQIRHLSKQQHSLVKGSRATGDDPAVMAKVSELLRKFEMAELILTSRTGALQSELATVEKQISVLTNEALL